MQWQLTLSLYLSRSYTHMSTPTEWILRHQQLIAGYTSAVTVVLVMVSMCIHTAEAVNVCISVCTTGYGYEGLRYL